MNRAERRAQKNNQIQIGWKIDPDSKAVTISVTQFTAFTIPWAILEQVYINCKDVVDNNKIIKPTPGLIIHKNAN